MMPGALAFTQPAILLALAALPVLWLVLRAVPPAARHQRFAAVRLLLGLNDAARQADHTPWWLLALRSLAIAAAITGLAGPVLNPAPQAAGNGPLLIVMDASWAEAPDWAARQDLLAPLLEAAARQARPLALIRLTDPPQMPQFRAAQGLTGHAAPPAAFAPSGMAAWALALPPGDFATLWLSDGLDHPGRAALHAALAARGAVQVLEPRRDLLALAPASMKDGAVSLRLLRPFAGPPAVHSVIARGPDPAGTERDLARISVPFAAGAVQANAALSLPPELRNRLTRFEIQDHASAGAVSLTDDRLKRRKVAILPEGGPREGLTLLDQTHFLTRALSPSADLVAGNLTAVLQAGPDVIILADIARLSPAETESLTAFVTRGGLLLRFAGPRLAAIDPAAAAQDDPLLPVRLRAGGREIGGAMSWGDPRPLAPFAEGSPFHGLPVPPDVTVSRQVLAEPGPDLAEASIAALADGTPLVTRKLLGAGQIVLFHVSANAEWSSLPLSGLFVQMLERLAVTAGAGPAQTGGLEGRVWRPLRVLDASGGLISGEDLPGLDGALLAKARAEGPFDRALPGLYADGARVLALNVVGDDTRLRPALWPAGTKVDTGDAAPALALKGALLTGALALLLADVLCALWLSGRLFALRALPLALLAALCLPAPPGQAQSGDALAIAATEGVVLAYVRSGEPSLDALSLAGLRGLSDRLSERTAVEPLEPMAVDIETDELAFYPFLYWPIRPGQPLPSPAAYDRLNAFLRSGGMILFDTRDGDLPSFGPASPEAETLRALALGLDAPALGPVPQGHILTRSFYLIDRFPGRHDSPALWVEAALQDPQAADGPALPPQNDGVTPLVIGGNDWASAWATDEWGVALYPIGRGEAGERQREAAVRFGINLIMHVLTGNYKSDQVHVPALLDRLGQ